MAGRTNQLAVLRARRKGRGDPFTQSAVAYGAGISPTRYNAIENGNHPAPTHDEIDRLAKYFGVPASKLGLTARESAVA